MTDKNIKENKTLGQRVKWMRKTKGWSQTDLANKCGITYQNIQNVEKGRVQMPQYIQSLATALETTIEYLIKGEVEPNVVRLPETYSLVSLSSPIMPDKNVEYYVVKINKEDQLFLPDNAEKVSKVQRIFISHIT